LLISRTGGYLGYNCSHVYPHTTKTQLNFLAPDNLKGADMVMYEIFRSLGLKVSFRPAVTDLHYSDNDGDARPVIGLSLGWQDWDFCPDECIEEEYDGWTGKAYQMPDYVRFEDVHWLNDLGHQEPQIFWIAVSGLMQLELLALPGMSHAGLG
jgi:hypothetical protein